MYFLLGFTPLISLVFQLWNPFPPGSRCFPCCPRLSVTLRGAPVSPVPFPAAQHPPEQREPPAPGARSLDLGGRRRVRSSTSRELQLQNSCGPSWGKGPAAIPPCRQRGKHGPFPAALHSQTPSGSRSSRRKEPRAGGALVLPPFSTFSITSLRSFAPLPQGFKQVGRS